MSVSDLRFITGSHLESLHEDLCPRVLHLRVVVDTVRVVGPELIRRLPIEPWETRRRDGDLKAPAPMR